MYATEGAAFNDGCKLTIPIKLENGPSPKKIPIPFKHKDERTC